MTRSVRRSALALTLLLSACAQDSAAPQGPGSAPSTSGAVVLTPSALTLTSLEHASVTFRAVWDSRQGTIWWRIATWLTPSQRPAPAVVWNDTGTGFTIDATGAAPGDFTLQIELANKERTHQIFGTLKLRVTQDGRAVVVGRVPRQTLTPGGTVTVALPITPPGNGTPISAITVTSAAPELVTATLTGQTVTLTAATTALQQGPIPIQVEVRAGDQVAKTRIPVQIGDMLDREWARFNVYRAMAGVPRVLISDAHGMDCWLHGRYMLVNHRVEHTEDLSLPFATPEGKACAAESDLGINTLPPEFVATVTPATDSLFGVPFHALTLIDPRVTIVGIGSYAARGTDGNVRVGSGLRPLKNDLAPRPTTPVLFPADGATMPMTRFSGGEWPNPLTACAGIDPAQAGQPLIAMGMVAGPSTATAAALSVDGQAVPVCAYGSTQYVNTTDPDAQATGRSIMEENGSAFVIPKVPLVSGKTYHASVTVNGRPIAWTFSVAARVGGQQVRGGQATLR